MASEFETGEMKLPPNPGKDEPGESIVSSAGVEVAYVEDELGMQFPGVDGYCTD